MKKSTKLIVSSSLALSLAPLAQAATTFLEIIPFDPDTYFDGGFTAGIDFNDGSPTQAGFTGIAASNAKSYNVDNNGVTFDIVVNNAPTGNQNRDRGAGSVSAPHGDLTRDFEQWFNNSGTGTAPWAVITFSGLVANTEYDIDLFHFNIGSGDNTVNFYDGNSTAATLITASTTGGNDNDQSTWNPGIKVSTTSDSNGEIVLTAEAGTGSTRLTLNGIALYQGAPIPEPSSTALLGLGGLALILRRRR